MTTIVGIQGDGFSLLCSDSRISDLDRDGGVSQMFTLGTGHSKIAVNGPFHLGAAGDLRAINLLAHAFVPPAPVPQVTGKKLDAYLTVKFIPELRDCFEKYGYSLPERDASSHLAEHGSILMCSVNAVIYVIDGDYSWITDAAGFYSIGSGSQFALGALHALAGGKKLSLQQARVMALKAMAAAAKYDPCTGLPYNTFVQESPTKTIKQVGKSVEKRT